MKALFSLPLLVLASSHFSFADEPTNASSNPLENATKIEEIGVDKYGKKAMDALPLYAPCIESARLSTAQVCARGNAKPLVLATVVSEKGYLVTKASELEKNNDLTVTFAKSPAFPNGLTLGAKVVDTYKAYDLALLKTDATGLKAATFSKLAPEPGTFLIASGLEPLPITYGVASVVTRSFDEGNKGFLGVGLMATEKGLSIFRITDRSAAYDAGLAVNDVVLKVNGSGISSVEEFIRTVSGYKPSEKISIRIRRGNEEKDVDAVLRRRGEFPEAVRSFEDPRNAMSGALSAQRSGFPAALQHDLFLKPSQCGGPLTNIEGEVVGVNIAHSGRTESLALNGSTLTTLLQTVDQGKFYHPEVDELTKAKANLELEVKRMNEMETRLKSEIEALGKKLEAIIGK